MKKLLLLMGVVLSLGLHSQTQSLTVSLGGSVSQNIFTSSLELGVQNSKNGFFFVQEIYNGSVNLEYYAGLKYYRQILDAGSNTTIWVFGATKVHFSAEYKDVVFEPGVAFSVDLKKDWAIQPSVSTPIYENSALFKPVNLSAGISINYTFK